MNIHDQLMDHVTLLISGPHQNANTKSCFVCLRTQRHRVKRAELRHGESSLRASKTKCAALTVCKELVDKTRGDGIRSAKTGIVILSLGISRGEGFDGGNALTCAQ